MLNFLSKLKMRLLPEPMFRVPRIWSNNELKKFSHQFVGSVVNVSAWEDSDKQGGKYKDYFSSAFSYDITNHTGTRGLIGNEITIDLEKELPKQYVRKWNVVFNHTTLEHVYDFKKAFDNLCKMSNQTVIIVVPWYQEYHTTDSYGDYWRFSEEVMQKMFNEKGFRVVYSSVGGSKVAQYVFIIAQK